MYNIGEYISYGNNGVCEIVGTETMDSSMENVDSRQCYILRPLHDRSCKIMTPVDNQKVISVSANILHGGNDYAFEFFM